MAYFLQKLRFQYGGIFYDVRNRLVLVRNCGVLKNTPQFVNTPQPAHIPAQIATVNAMPTHTHIPTNTYLCIINKYSK